MNKPATASSRIPNWPGPVLRLTSAESTQDLAKTMAQNGSPEWTLVLADRQTHGRGRMSRRWSSPKGGLYCSIVLRPEISPRRLGELSILAARAAAKAVVSTSGLETAVKPPNDVLAKSSRAGAWKKVCGILIEASGGSSQTEWVVVGLGLNVNNRVSSDLPNAGSLKGLAGREFDLDSVAARLLSEMKSAYRSFISSKNHG